jgi:hypothetical protein
VGERLELTPCPLTLAGGLVTVFRAVIQALVCPMLLCWLPCPSALNIRSGTRGTGYTDRTLIGAKRTTR